MTVIQMMSCEMYGMRELSRHGILEGWWCSWMPLVV